MAVAKVGQRCVREAFPHILFVFDDLLGGGAADYDAVVLEVGVAAQGGLPRSSRGMHLGSMTPASTSVLGLDVGGRAAGTDPVHIGDEYRSGTSRSGARTARPRDVLGTHRHRAGHEAAV